MVRCYLFCQCKFAVRKHIMRKLFTCIIIFWSFSLSAQKLAKEIPAVRTLSVIKIDGVPDEQGWKEVPAVLGFTEFRPSPFRKEDPENRTEIRMLYNDEGIYLSGFCFERTKDSISSELTGRDGFGNNDFIGFVFDTYMDKVNGFEYFVTPLGEQMDAKVSPNLEGNSEDFSWNAVWKSAAKIHENGWSFEIFLPFSAIRFSKKNIQDWGLNIIRRRAKTGQQLAWNTIDVTVNGFLTQSGVWKNLENIKPPIRLQFSPYLSFYSNHYPYNKPDVRNWTSSINGGMDVKYGISQALTLDMTLIPDFGQVQSDNQVLNLSPFEVKFNENRSFFTEGTELFNRGNLLYTRRIGGTPLHYYDVQDSIHFNEHLLTNPTESRLINATKISGRLQSGLGIGFLNAITATQYAIIENSQGVQRKIQTNPVTNYNVFVLNQSLKHNSSISIINTNVLRGRNDYKANVLAGLFDLNDKKNMWNVGGKVAFSSLIGYSAGKENLNGYSHNLYFGKTSGRFSFNLSEELSDTKFNSNDLGYYTNNNFLSHFVHINYNWVKPTKWYNNINAGINGSYTQLYMPLTYQNANFNASINGQLKNLWQVGAIWGYEPGTNNFYEARTPGRVFKGWSDWFAGLMFQSNNAKKYFVYSEFMMVSRNLYHSKRYKASFKQTYRFNQKFSVSQSTELQPQTDNVGFAGFNGNDIIFGRRNISSVENTCFIKYNFNNRMALTTSIRHYWSRVTYKEYFTLGNSGTLEKNNSFTGNANENFNSLKVDAVYTWQFAPGSFINLVWKNNAGSFEGITTVGYLKNLENTIASPQNNNLSLKVIYFLDYVSLKKRGK